MLWLRTVLFSLPLVFAFGVYWIYQQVKGAEYVRVDKSLVCVTREPVGNLNPLVPLTGVTREITDMLFEPLLVRDDDLNIRENLITGWEYRTLVTVRFAEDEYAGESEAMLRAGDFEKDSELKILQLEREGSVLTAAIDGFDESLVDGFLEILNPEGFADYELIRLSLRNSAQDSFETFLRSSVEKSQIRMLDYDGDKIVNIFLKGETDLFLKELRLYYESNRNLEPEIEQLGERSHTSSREMVIRLRNDVRWHDGQFFSSDDVIFTFNELTRPGSMVPLAESFWFVEDIEKIDQRTFKVTCNQSPGVMLESWEKLSVLPSHLLKTKTSQSEWVKFFEAPVGNGPYQLLRRREDGGVELKANEAYFAGVPAQKTILYKPIPERGEKLRALLFGELETLVADERDKAWLDRHSNLVREIRGIPRFQNFIAWNLDNPFLSDNQVRVALAKSIDIKATLFDTVNSYQTQTESLFFPGAPYCPEPMFLPEYDVKTAGDLLESAGFEKDGEFFVNQKKRPVTFTLTVNKENPEQMKLAKSLAAQWRKFGLKIELEPLSWSELLTGRLAVRKYDAVMLGWELPFERDRFATWHSSQIGPTGGNFCGLRNPVVDELLVNLRSEKDEEKSYILAAELQKEIAQLQPYLFLCDTGRIHRVRRDAMKVVRKGLDGKMTPEPLSIGKAGNDRVRPWWVRTDLIEESADSL